MSRGGRAKNGPPRTRRPAAPRRSRVPPAADFAHADSRRHGRKQASAGRKLSRILAAFEPYVGMARYLFGSRPSLADFAWFGQLSEIATDPTPMRIMREKRRSPIIGYGGWMMLPVWTGPGIRASRRCRNERSAARDCRRTLSAVSGRQCAGLREASSGWRSMSGGCLMRCPRSNIRSNASVAARQICRARRGRSSRAKTCPGTHGMLDASDRELV